MCVAVTCIEGSMKTILHTIVLENFKTYEGSVIIGPLKAFMAVVGPNGTGKSNLMDAISFVLGDSISNLRVKQPRDLIHGANVGRPVAERASVTANFKNEDGTVSIFQRTVSKRHQKYLLNLESVTVATYLRELEKLGINVKAKNFLVYQGTVESIAVMDSKQRSSLFEEISGSKNLKVQYEELKKEMAKAEDMTHMTYEKKRGYNLERKEARLERNEAVKYERLREELASKNIEYQLFRLFHNEKNIEHLENTVAINLSKLEDLENAKMSTDKGLKKAKKSCGAESRELAKLETGIHDREKKINEMRPALIKAKEEVYHVRQKSMRAKKSFENAQEVHNKHSETVKALYEELSTLEERRAKFEADVLSQSQGSDIELGRSQVREYNEKKIEAVNLTATVQQELDSLTREQKADHDCYENEERSLLELADKIKQKSSKRDEEVKRSERLADHISSAREELKKLHSQERHLVSNLTSSKEQMVSIQTELEEITAQLGDAHFDTYYERQRRKKYQVVLTLKELFSGVYDRLINLCEPVHPKYAVAITKVMGKNLQAIVVDNEKTARECIQYLKEQMMEPETFLPLDLIKAEPLKESLRTLNWVSSVSLLYDVLKYDPPQVKQAVLFAVKSVIVCNTQEDALAITYERKLEAVSLDGTLYKKSGIISGGVTDLVRKSRQWDEKQIVQLKEKREKLSESLREINKNCHKEFELNSLQCLIEGLKSRSVVMNADLKKTHTSIADLDKEIHTLQENLEERKLIIEQIKHRMKKRESSLENLKKKLHSIEDEVFTEFCFRIGVPNIRSYEKEGLRQYEEQEKQRMEFEDQKNRIQTQLDYEKTVNTEDNIKRWEDEVKRCKDALQLALSAEESHLKVFREATDSLEHYKATVAHKKEEVDALEKIVAEVLQEVKEKGDTIHNVRKELLGLENKIESLQRMRRSLLLQCKVESIAIPVLEGTVEGIFEGNSESSSGNGDSSSSNNASQAMTAGIVVDYNQLSNDYKRLAEADDIKKCEAKLKQSVKKLTLTINSIKAPNMKVVEKLELTTEKLKETNDEFVEIRRQAIKAKENFDRVKAQRYKLFMDCFDFVSNEIDDIYKHMTKSRNAMALLTAECPEEPYLGGVSYCCIAPGKSCQPMQSLSGGEKTVAAIALLISMHMYQTTPCLVLDEIDAALDNSNIGRIADYLSNQNFQTIAISHRPEFYQHANGLIGITSDGGESSKSKTFLFDLEQYAV